MSKSLAKIAKAVTFLRSPEAFTGYVFGFHRSHAALPFTLRVGIDLYRFIDPEDTHLRV
jgi:hypothetical protein